MSDNLDNKVIELGKELEVSPYAFVSELNHDINNYLQVITSLINRLIPTESNVQGLGEISCVLRTVEKTKDAIVNALTDMYDGIEYDDEFTPEAFYAVIGRGIPNAFSDWIETVRKRVSATEFPEKNKVEPVLAELAQYVEDAGNLLNVLEPISYDVSKKRPNDFRYIGKGVAEAAVYAEEKRPIVLKPGKIRILVVDDEPLVRRVVSDMLGRRGYDVDQAPGGQKAIQMLEEAHAAGEPYGGLVTDLDMPGVSGKDVLKVANRLKVGALALTGRPGEIPDAVKAGAHAGVSKPITMEKLLPEVESALLQYTS